MVEGEPAPDIRPSELSDDQRRLLRGFDAGSPKMQKAFLRFADMVDTFTGERYEQFIVDKWMEVQLRRGYDVRAFLTGPPNVAETA